MKIMARTLLLLAGMTAATTANAQTTYYWDGGTVNIGGNGNGISAGGAGNWSTAISNWDTGAGLPYGVWDNAVNRTAVFGGTAGTVTLTTPITVGGMQFDTTGYNITTGANTLTLLQRDEQVITDVARLVGASTDDLVGGVQRRLDEVKSLQDELKTLRAQLATGRAAELAAAAQGSVVVQRIDGLAPGDLRELAIAVRQQPGIEIVVLVGVSDTGGVSLVGAVTSSSGKVAGDLIKDAARAVGGGGGGKGDVATAGGKNADGIDEALRLATAAATT